MATICLDPGHGGHDPGALRDGMAEKDVTLSIARAARDRLIPAHSVVLTRDTDVAVALAERRGIADAAGADLFVSIHVNASARPAAAGFEVLVRSEAQPGSAALARAVANALAARFPDRRNRGVRTALLAVLRQERPSCLVECFFLSNEDERRLLARPATRVALGEAIGDGCVEFLRAPVPPAPVPSVRRPVPAGAGRERTGRRTAPSPRPPGSRPA